MADDKKKAAASNGVTDQWVEIQLDRPMFKAELFCERIPGTKIEKYTGSPIEGYLLGYAEMPAITDSDTGEQRDWAAYIVQLTKPAKVVKRGEQEAKEVPAGEEILVAATAILKQNLPPEVANHPKQMIKVRLTPLQREEQAGSDRKLWRYKLDTAPQPVPRTGGTTGNSVLQQMLASAKAYAAQLSDGRTINTTGESVS